MVKRGICLGGWLKGFPASKDRERSGPQAGPQPRLGICTASGRAQRRDVTERRLRAALHAIADAWIIVPCGQLDYMTERSKVRTLPPRFFKGSALRGRRTVG